MAISSIKQHVGDSLIYSSIYETKAWGYNSDNDYWNMIVVVQTALTPQEILNVTQGIEKEMGRTQKSVNATYSDRVIDIDIVLFGNKVINNSKLVVPHEKMLERKFVMIPLSEVYGQFVHPTALKTIAELAECCSDVDEPLKVIDKLQVLTEQI